VTEPRVAILLLNWNGRRDTIECLESIAQLAYSNYFIVLCDNASTDDSVASVRTWAGSNIVELDRSEAERGHARPAAARMILIHNGDNLGFAAGNNVGLRYLVAQPEVDYVWMLNNDVIVEAQSLSELVRSARSEDGIGGVGTTIFEYHQPTVVQAAGGGVFSQRHFNPDLITRPRREAEGRAPRLDFISGASLMVPMEALIRVGFIDEAFFIYCEDVDFCVRLRALGLKLIHAEAAHIWHKGGSSLGHRSLRHDYYTVRNTLAVVRKHYPAMVAVAAAYLFYRAVLPKLVRRQGARLKAVWRGFRDFRNHVTGPVQV
jgi:GT2 family glycosyltransferase